MTLCSCDSEADKLESHTLWTLLIINAFMFIAEAGFGMWAESTALLADSLDMAADATVYAISLFAVGRSVKNKVRAAKASGIFQVVLGGGVLVTVLHRALSGSEPVSLLMIAVGAIALTANVVCLILIAKHRGGGAHMRASWIFSKNDVIANLGVIISGVAVMLSGSRVPDLVVGAVVALVVVRGGVSILREASQQQPTST